jgi:hypothetical protein
LAPQHLNGSPDNRRNWGSRHGSEIGSFDVFPELQIEYSIQRWSAEAVQIVLKVEGKRATQITIVPDSNGTATIRTPHGPLVITRIEGSSPTFQGRWEQIGPNSGPSFNADLSVPARQQLQQSIRQEEVRITNVAQRLSRRRAPMVRFTSAPLTNLALLKQGPTQ